MDDQVFKINLRHPVNDPFDVKDVVSAACRYFTSDRFHMPLQQRIRSELCGLEKTHQRDSEKLIQRLFGDNPDSETEGDDTLHPRNAQLTRLGVFVSRS